MTNNHSNQIYQQKVKLYLLAPDNTWTQCGLGLIIISQKMLDDPELNVIRIYQLEDDRQKKQSNEEDAQQYPIMLQIVLNKIYTCSMENNTIIVFQIDQAQFALSFKDQNLQFSKKIFKKMSQFSESITFPNRENFIAILEQTKSNCKNTIEKICQPDGKFLSGLKYFLDEIEDLSDQFTIQNQEQNLFGFFFIMKSIFNEADQAVLRLLMQQQNLMFTIGCLQYNPKNIQKRNFREEIKKLKCHNILNFPEHIYKQKLLLNSRLNFLKDCVIPTFIEPLGQLIINHIINENNLAVFQLLIENTKYFKSFVEIFFTNIQNSIGFLLQLILMLKTTTYDIRSKIYIQLIKINIYSILHMTLVEIQPIHYDFSNWNNRITCEKIFQIIYILTQIDVCYIEEFIAINIKQVQQKDGYNFCEYLVYIFKDGIFTLKNYVIEIIKNILNPEQNRDKLNHSQLIYKYFLEPLCDQSYEKNSSEVNLMIGELLISIYNWNPIKSRRLIIESKYLIKLQIEGNKKHNLLLLIKFLKFIILDLQDPDFYRYIKKNNFLNKLVVPYKKNINKHNIINSSFTHFFSQLQKSQSIDSQIKQDFTKIFEFPFTQSNSISQMHQSAQNFEQVNKIELNSQLIFQE